MTTLVWDQIGKRTYQTGVDHGVLYLPDGTSAVWNGLTSVEERFTQERKPYYLDGVKYLEHLTPGDFAAQLKAFTYPEEFEQVTGVRSKGSGVFVHDQNSTSFGLSYRTLIGDDVSGTERGYKIHLLYNVTAIPDNNVYASLRAQPIEFSWALSGTAEAVPGYRPTAHVTLDSTKMTPALLAEIEAILYGTALLQPRLPALQELVSLIYLVIVDNGDGTWTATGPAHLIVMVDSTTFQLPEVDAVYLNPTTYVITI